MSGPGDRLLFLDNLKNRLITTYNENQTRMCHGCFDGEPGCNQWMQCHIYTIACMVGMILHDLKEMENSGPSAEARVKFMKALDQHFKDLCTAIKNLMCEDCSLESPDCDAGWACQTYRTMNTVQELMREKKAIGLDD